jgi:alcohol dehydrogenase (cytochrome c)
MYFPMANTCMTATSIADEATPEMVYAINTQTIITPGTDDVGTIRAISAQTGEQLWRYDQRAGLMALLATAGDLVFGGDVQGKFRAFDAASGEVLWETQLAGQVTGHPVTFRADGKQFVAVSTGRSNLTGSLGRYAPEVSPRDNQAHLYVFALPD